MRTVKLVFFLLIEIARLQFNSGLPNIDSNGPCAGGDTSVADVIFVLDSSISICEQDFKRQVQFVSDVIDQFPIGPNNIQVGVVSFSNWAQPEFQLNDHKDKTQIQNALRSVLQMMGDTNTASALAYVRDVMLTSENGARPEVPHVVIVLTDGKSNDAKQTALEAAASKQRGDVHLFAIGVGSQVDRMELNSIASEPSEQFVFTVDNYATLGTVKELLAIKACHVTNRPALVTSTPDPSVQVDQACGSGGAADVLLAGSPFANDSATRATLKFFKDIAAQLDIGPDRVHVGVVPKDCDSVPAVSLQTFEPKTLRQLMKRSVPSTASVLSYMNDVGFHPRHGGRAGAKKIGLVVVDGVLDEVKTVVEEANRAKKGKNVELFVVAVGKEVLGEELKGIATSSNHIFHVSGYNELNSIADRVASSICPV